MYTYYRLLNNLNINCALLHFNPLYTMKQVLNQISLSASCTHLISGNCFCVCFCVCMCVHACVYILTLEVLNKHSSFTNLLYKGYSFPMSLYGTYHLYVMDGHDFSSKASHERLLKESNGDAVRKLLRY